MTTKEKAPRPVAGWTKQVASFATSFAFFGLAGFLQSQAAPSSEPVAAPIQPAVTAEPVIASAQGDHVAQTELLGPVQPISETPAAAPETEVTQEVAPAPVVSTPAPAQSEPAPVDGHTAAS
jgi:hypothetical protein